MNILYTEEEHRLIQEDITKWRNLSGPVGGKRWYPYKSEVVKEIWKKWGMRYNPEGPQDKRVRTQFKR
jgi:hypothetical protein